ncbi:glycoside hydrolase family 15 protein [Candidatus Saccharibacteria bacterium]|nr:glycoside hydrolase family 15 protein [Candidatus Saccharibacteria bacterium]
MARPIILSNGEMAIGLNTFGMVHDFYYPYVGLENHSSERATRHRIGLFIEGAIHWLSDGSWKIKQEYIPGRLIGKTVATNEWLGFTIEFQDFVDSELSVFARNIHVINHSDRPREAKLFLHQAFIIGEAADGHDTAQYIPPMNGQTEAILHYKGKRAFLVSGDNLQTKNSFDSFSIGCFGEFGDSKSDGVWRDAEDGELARNPVERIQTDSILQYSLNFGAHDSVRVHYFLAAGKSHHEARRTLDKFNGDGLLTRLMKTDQYWRNWIASAQTTAEVKVAPEYRQHFLTSLLILKAMMDRRGAIMASCDTEMLKYTRDAYVDCWPRDAGYAFWVFLRLGYYNEIRQFFRFARDVISDEGFFWQMYRPDATIGPNSHAYVHDGGEIAPPIQTDETAIVLFLLAKTIQTAVKTGDKIENWREMYEDLGRPIANFLSDYIDPATKLPRASYELWEVLYQTTTYCAAVTFGALEAAAELAEMFGETNNVIKWRNTASEIRESAGVFWNKDRNYFYRGFWRHRDGREFDYDHTIDASAFYGAWAFRLFDDAKLETAFRTLTERFYIRENNVGLPRFEGDDYNRQRSDGEGNPWFITSFWIAQYAAERGETDLTKKVLDWANDQMMRTNILPEQVSPLDGRMLSAAPLSWSHAEFINTCLDYGNSKNDVPEEQENEVSTEQN